MFTHPDAHALYRSVLANPDDDAPRLILADWLEEHDQANRAEFIRFGCAVARDPFADGFHTQRDRLASLWEENATTWLNELPHISGISWGRFRRGFCEEVRLSSVKSFQRHFTKLATTAPISHWRFLHAEALEEIAGWKALKHVRGLDFSQLYSGGTEDTIVSILLSPYLVELHSFIVGLAAITKRTIQAIADQPACSQLRELSVRHNSLGDAIVLLGQSDHLNALEIINMDRTDITAEGLAALAQSPVLRTLRRLRLGDSFGAAGVEAIIHSPTMTNLKSFVLDRPGNGYECVNAIAGCPNVASWRELDLICPVGVEGVEALASSPYLANLESLSIFDGSVGESGLYALLRSPYMKNLRQLSFTNTTFSNTSIKRLLESPTLANLRYLGLSSNRLAFDVKEALKSRFGKRYNAGCDRLYDW